MSDQNIMGLPGLSNGGEMSDREIAEALNIPIKGCRARLSSLVVQELLERIPGIASRPAHYRIKTSPQISLKLKASA